LVSGVKRKTLLLATPVILACVVFAPRLVTDSLSAKPLSAPASPSPDRLQSAPPPAAGQPATLSSDESDGRVPSDEPELLDLYGNEVTDAVAKYRFDASGSLYELHSPQTEVPKLAPPKS
jgi:hypothetical protein